MVQREQWDTSWGPKKLIFLIRDIDDAAMAGASVESCQFVVLRVSRGSLLVGIRRAIAYAACAGASIGRFTQDRSLSQHALPTMILPQVLDPKLSGEPQTTACGLGGDYPTPDLSRRSPRADLHPKKVNNLGPMAPRSRKKRQLPEGPQES